MILLCIFSVSFIQHFVKKTSFIDGLNKKNVFSWFLSFVKLSYNIDFESVLFYG